MNRDEDVGCRAALRSCLMLCLSSYLFFGLVLVVLDVSGRSRSMRRVGRFGFEQRRKGGRERGGRVRGWDIN